MDLVQHRKDKAAQKAEEETIERMCVVLAEPNQGYWTFASLTTVRLSSSASGWTY